MAYSESLDERDNIISDFDEVQKQGLVDLVNERWVYSTHEIRDLIEQSRLAWDYFLRNHPTPNTLALAGTKDIYSAEQAQRKGLRFPHIPLAVESILAMQHNATFPADDRFFRGSPVNEEAERNQELIEQFLSESFGLANTSEEFRKLRLNLMLDGTACLFTKWEQKKNPRKVDYEVGFRSIKIPTNIGEVSELVPWGVKETKKEDIEWEGTRAIPLDFNDWRVDPAARRFEDSWFIRRWYEPVYKIKEEYPMAVPYKESLPDGDDNSKREAAGLKPIHQIINPEIEEEGRQNALLMICYDDFVINDVVYENHALCILNTNEAVWFGPVKDNHGRRPYIVGSYIEIPGQIYGQSAVVHAIPCAEAIDKAADNMLRSSTWGGNPIILKNINDPAVRQHKNVRVRPGIVLPVSDPNAYTQLQIRTADLQPLLVLMEKAEEKLMRVIGNSPFTEGGEPQQGRVSAFEVDQRVQGGNSRAVSLMRTFENAFMEPFMHISYENFRQYMEKSVMINGKKVTRDMLRLSKFRWLIVSTQAALSRNRELTNKRAFLVELLPQLVQAGSVKLKPEVAEFDLINYIKELMSKGGEKDVDRHLKVIPGAIPQMMGPVGDVPQNSEVAGALPAVPPTPNDARSELPPEPAA